MLEELYLDDCVGKLWGESLNVMTRVGYVGRVICG